MKQIIAILFASTLWVACDQSPSTLKGYVWTLETLNDSLASYQEQMFFDTDSALKIVDDMYIGGLTKTYATLYDSILFVIGNGESEYIYNFSQEGLTLKTDTITYKYSYAKAEGDVLTKFLLDYDLGKRNGLPNRSFMINDELPIKDQIGIYEQTYADLKRRVKYPEDVKIYYSILSSNVPDNGVAELLVPENQRDDYQVTIHFEARNALQQYESESFTYWVDNNDGIYEVFNMKDEYSKPFEPVRVSADHPDALNIFKQAIAFLKKGSSKVSEDKVTSVSIFDSDDETSIYLNFDSNVVRERYGYSNLAILLVSENGDKYVFKDYFDNL